MEGRSRTSPLTALALAFIAIVWISPVGWLLTTSIDPKTRGLLEFPRAIGIDNFISAVSGKAGLQFLNSVWLSVGTATLTVIIGAAAAYPLSRMKMPGRDLLLWGLVLLRLLPATGVVVPLYFAALWLHVLNNFGVLLALTVLNLPFALLLLKNFFDTVPIELEEAAYVEGASLSQIITQIVMPLSRSGIAVVWFYCFTNAWNEFLLPLIFTRTDIGFPMSVGLFAAFGQHGAVDYGFLAAYSVIYATPAVAVYFLLRRNLNTGFAGVGVKG
jgi:multiple sugar transport system permease protein